MPIPSDCLLLGGRKIPTKAVCFPAHPLALNTVTTSHSLRALPCIEHRSTCTLQWVQKRIGCSEAICSRDQMPHPLRSTLKYRVCCPCSSCHSLSGFPGEKNLAPGTACFQRWTWYRQSQQPEQPTKRRRDLQFTDWREPLYQDTLHLP